MKKTKKQAEEEQQKKSSELPVLIAKKDFEIFQNDYHRKIKAGDDLSDIPEQYRQNLITEGII